MHSNDIASDPVDGWDWFDLRADLTRVIRGSDQWRFTALNAAFELCAPIPTSLPCRLP
jgi:hypothetical protein